MAACQNVRISLLNEMNQRLQDPSEGSTNELVYKIICSVLLYMLPPVPGECTVGLENLKMNETGTGIAEHVQRIPTKIDIFISGKKPSDAAGPEFLCGLRVRPDVVWV